ncbi:UNVERIFIED_CONTAM: Retrovirus-related Pol polyprotein from transposon [Sesamum indicum]
MNDPIIIKLDIANFTVDKVLVDSGSSADFIFKSVINKMSLENIRLEPVKTPLVGFGGSEVTSLGMVELPVSMGDKPRRKTTMVKFLVVDMPFAYNVILSRPGLNLFRAVISTYHMKMKFPTDHGVGEVACDQKEARKCYNLSLKGELGQKKRKVKEDAEPRPYEAQHLKPSDVYKVVQLSPDEPDKTTRIGAGMKEKEMAMISFLRENMDKKRSFGSDKNEIIRKEVDKLLKAGYVSEIQYTDWLSNVVVVPKSSGKWRMCVDFTDLNKECPKDPYPLPRIDVMVDSTTGATYQRLVNKMFGDLLGKTMEVYVDGMLVKSKRLQDHLADLAQAFAIMRSYGMKLNPDKCTFGVGGGKFLGYMVSERGIEANLEKIQAIINLRSPTTIKEPKNFEWDEECERALQELKNYLTTPPLLGNPKDGEVLFLYLSVSGNAVSSILVREDGGQQNLIYYVSKMLQGAELRYTEMEKLALALVVTARKLRPYFQSHKVIVLTNHPLKHIMSRPEASGILIKWAVELGQYDVEYQPRTTQKAQVLADFVMELLGDPKSPPVAEGQVSKWMLHVDGASNANNGGAGILIQGPKGVEIVVAARLSFPMTNNEAEYEAPYWGWSSHSMPGPEIWKSSRILS